MRASRLVSILLLLQTRDRMTARELAAWLEVSERTVYRDVQSLSAAGIPVYGEAGHDGGYRLVGGYRTRLTGLTAAEAESLFLSGLPVAAADLGLGEAMAMAEAQSKLMAALPPESRKRAARLRGRVHLDDRS
ncbi:helix-turn-helix transcriptional regulator [Actinomadura geliboluensis]|uniref:helix-turn-helix transcriptional regulator n=1 Tax=Actinomadura geliboluensis TaxID=882440 RepID=UPI0036AAF73A